MSLSPKRAELLLRIFSYISDAHKTSAPFLSRAILPLKRQVLRGAALAPGFTVVPPCPDAEVASLLLRANGLNVFLVAQL